MSIFQTWEFKIYVLVHVEIPDKGIVKGKD